MPHFGRILVLAAVLGAAGDLGGAPSARPESGPEDRPCGPASLRGPLRRVIQQGCAGADFREACRRHDACYGREGSQRRTCDLEYLEAMLEQCPDSRFPPGARALARFHFLVVRVAGQRAWKVAQGRVVRPGRERIFPE